MNPAAMEWLATRIAAAQRVEEFTVHTPVEYASNWKCPPMEPCYSKGDWGAAALVKYTKAKDEQRAFDLVASMLPEGVKLAPQQEGGPQWTVLKPFDNRGDSMAVYGYIGWKWSPAR